MGDSMTRHQKRVDAMIYLYQTLLRDDIEHDSDQEAFLSLHEDFQKVINYIFSDKKELSELIDDELNDWEFSRLGFIEQAILLLACGEAVILQTPKTALINEAIEMSKSYGDQDDTYKLINATLDKVLDI